MFDKALPNLHDMSIALEVELTKEKPKRISVENMRSFQKLLKQSIEVLNTRLYVVISAQQNGVELCTPDRGRDYS